MSGLCRCIVAKYVYDEVALPAFAKVMVAHSLVPSPRAVKVEVEPSLSA